MALSQRLEFRQSQALVMTPQLMQAIKLLQLSSLDLAAYVEGELGKNPLLERAGDDEEAPAVGAEADDAGEAEATRTRPRPAEWTGEELGDSRSSHGSSARHRTRKRLSRRGGREIHAAGKPPPAYSEWSGAGSAAADDDYNLEAFVSAEVTLADHLAEQMVLAISDPARRMIGQYLIDMVDEAGYLTGDLDSVAEKLGAPLTEVDAVLAILQTLDPPGVCARNLTECLPSSCRSATASTRRCACWSSTSSSWPSAILPACGGCAASTRKISPT